jgi:hypothetical protein
VGLAAGLALAHAVQLGHWTTAWPWFVPIGCTTATLFGYLLARPSKEIAT